MAVHDRGSDPRVHHVDHEADHTGVFDLPGIWRQDADTGIRRQPSIEQGQQRLSASLQRCDSLSFDPLDSCCQSDKSHGIGVAGLVLVRRTSGLIERLALAAGSSLPLRADLDAREERM